MTMRTKYDSRLTVLCPAGLPQAINAAAAARLQRPAEYIRAAILARLQADVGAFVSALAKDFEEHGEGVIRIARIEKPVEYLRLIASIMPKEFIVSESELDIMNDDELAEALSIVRQARAARTAPPQ